MKASFAGVEALREQLTRTALEWRRATTSLAEARAQAARCDDARSAQSLTDAEAAVREAGARLAQAAQALADARRLQDTALPLPR